MFSLKPLYNEKLITTTSSFNDMIIKKRVWSNSVEAKFETNVKKLKLITTIRKKIGWSNSLAN
jgi:hypothetical protein